MEAEQYCRCDVCGKTIPKRKAIKLMYSKVCEECFDKMLEMHEKVRNKKWEK